MVQEKPREYKAGDHCPRCKSILILDEDEVKCQICSRIFMKRKDTKAVC